MEVSINSYQETEEQRIIRALKEKKKSKTRWLKN